MSQISRALDDVFGPVNPVASALDEVYGSEPSLSDQVIGSLGRPPVKPTYGPGAYEQVRGASVDTMGREPTVPEDLALRRAAGVPEFMGVPGAEPPVVGRQAVEPQGIVESVVGAGKSGLNDWRAANLMLEMATGQADERTVRQLAEFTRGQRVTPISEGTQKLGEVDGFVEGLQQLYRNPQGVMDLMSRSMASQLPGIVTAPVTGTIGIGATSGLLEFSSEFQNLLAAEGVDLSDERSISEMMRNPERVRSLALQAAKKAGVVGLGDMLTAGLASKVPGGRTVAGKVASAVGKTTVEATGGMGFEAGSQLASRGKITEPGAVALEGIAEVPGALPQAAQLAAGAAWRSARSTGDVATTQQREAAQSHPDISGDTGQGGAPVHDPATPPSAGPAAATSPAMAEAVERLRQRAAARDQTSTAAPSATPMDEETAAVMAGFDLNPDAMRARAAEVDAQNQWQEAILADLVQRAESMGDLDAARVGGMSQPTNDDGAALTAETAPDRAAGPSSASVPTSAEDQSSGSSPQGSTPESVIRFFAGRDNNEMRSVRNWVEEDADLTGTRSEAYAELVAEAKKYPEAFAAELAKRNIRPPQPAGGVTPGPTVKEDLTVQPGASNAQVQEEERQEEGLLSPAADEQGPRDVGGASSLASILDEYANPADVNLAMTVGDLAQAARAYVEEQDAPDSALVEALDAYEEAQRDHRDEFGMRDDDGGDAVYEAIRAAAAREASKAGGATESGPVKADVPFGEPHPETGRKFSSTQFDLPDDVASVVKAEAAKIPKANLAKDGREDRPHITIKYGLHADDAAAVTAALANVAPVTVTLGETSLFQNDDADVVKVDVESPALHELNKIIAGAVKTTDTHPKYQPHVTLAYVKPGRGKKYAGNKALAGKTITLDRLVFSGRDGKETVIGLRGTPKAAPAPKAKPAKEPWEMTREEYRNTDPGLAKARKEMDDAMSAVSSGNRWGETRRFSGRAAGNRIAKVDAAKARWQKAYDKADNTHRDSVESAIARGDIASHPDYPTVAGAPPASKPAAKPSPKPVGSPIAETIKATGLSENDPAIEFMGPGRGWPREGDPKPGDTVTAKGNPGSKSAGTKLDDRPLRVIRSWRTADASGPDGTLHLSLQSPTGEQYTATGTEAKKYRVATPPKAPKPFDPERGIEVSEGDTLKTSSGRTTTPFPKIDTGSEAKARNTVRRVDQWLIDNALAEARERGDDFNGPMFARMTPKSLSPADKASLNEYLFGEQPPVQKPITKPLVEKTPEKPTTPAFLSNLSPEKQARAEELRKRLQSKLNNELRSGFDPELFAIGVEYTTLYLESGVRKFADFAKKMVADVGAGVKPYLKAFYNGARSMPGVDTKGMDSAADVEAVDVDAALEAETRKADPNVFDENSPRFTVISGNTENRATDQFTSFREAEAWAKRRAENPKVTFAVISDANQNQRVVKDENREAEPETPGSAVPHSRAKKGILTPGVAPIKKAQAAAQEKRVADVLDVDIRSAEFGVLTRRQLVEKEVDAGYTPVIEQVRDDAAVKKATERKAVMDKGWVPTGNERHPKTIEYRALQETIKNPPTKPEYRMMKGERYRMLTKIEYDHAVKYQSGVSPVNRTEGDPKTLGLKDAATLRMLHRQTRNGWHYIESPNGAVLVHPSQDRAVRFEATNEKSGSDMLRARTEAQAYAQDNPVQAAPTTPPGELVVKSLATSDPRITYTPTRKNLTPEQRAAETELGRIVQDQDESDRVYNEEVKASEGGKIIGLDYARELLAAYRNNKAARITLTDATSMPARAWARDRIWRDVNNPPKRADGKKPILLLTAGSPGSGKSTSLADHVAQSDKVWDSNLTNAEDAAKVIDRAVEMGWDVRIRYVYRHFEETIPAIIRRALPENEGRIVVLSEAATSRLNGAKAIKELAVKYAGNPSIDVGAVHNVEGGPAAPVDVAEVAEGGPLAYTSSRLAMIIRAGLDEARASGQYPKEILDAVEGKPGTDGATGAGRVGGADQGGQSEPADGGESAGKPTQGGPQGGGGVQEEAGPVVAADDLDSKTKAQLVDILEPPVSGGLSSDATAANSLRRQELRKLSKDSLLHRIRTRRSIERERAETKPLLDAEVARLEHLAKAAGTSWHRALRQEAEANDVSMPPSTTRDETVAVLAMKIVQSRRERGATQTKAPAADQAVTAPATIGKYTVGKNSSGWYVHWTDASGAGQGRSGLKTREEAVALANEWHARDQENFKHRRATYPMTLSEWPKIRNQVVRAELSAEEHKEMYRWLIRSEAAIKEELGKQTLKQLTGQSSVSGYNKAQIIESVFRRMVDRFVLGESITWSPFNSDGTKNTYASAVNTQVESITDEKIAAYRDKINKAVEANKKALENPETLEEFRLFIAKKGEAALSLDQLKRRDALIAEAEMKANNRPKTISKVDTGAVQLTYKEGFHEKYQIPLHIVQLSGRVPDDVYQALNAAAKKLGGWWSSFKKDSTGFQFKTKEAADEFIKINQQSISTELTDEAREEQQAQQTAERLIAMADEKIDAADDELGKERNTNTVRRARMAEGAEASARKAKQMAQTLRNIAEAIQNGSVVALKYVKNMRQLEEIERMAMFAQREYWYSLPEESRRAIDPSGKWWNLPLDENVIAKVKMPMPEPHVDHLRTIAEVGLKTSGIKREAAKVDRLWRNAKRMKPDGYVVTIDSPYDFTAVKAVVSRLKDFGSAKSAAEAVYEALMHHQRVVDLGFRSTEAARTAVREYVGLRAGREKPDVIREMERALIGSTVGVDFFPTPPSVAKELVEKADIEAGMKVLEPSAGNGRIADAIKAAGVEPDVVELSSNLRAILSAKGHNVVAHDFTDYNPGPIYDRIVMNPPFSNRMDVEHVRHAYDLLKPGGRIVAIMSEGPFSASDKKSAEFREWLDEVGVSEKLEEGTFLQDKSGLPTTGVNTRVVVIDKPQAGEATQPVPKEVHAPRKVDTRAIVVEDLDAKTRDTDEFKSWLREMADDDAEFSTMQSDDASRREYVEDFLKETHQIRVLDDGVIEFEQLTPEVRELIGDNKVLVYHHTSEAALPSIRREGLVSGRKNVNRTMGEDSAGVYVTTEGGEYSPAVRGYRDRARQEWGSDPVALEIVTTLDSLQPDPDDQDIKSGRVQFVMASVPPSQIRFPSPASAPESPGTAAASENKGATIEGLPPEVRPGTPIVRTMPAPGTPERANLNSATDYFDKERERLTTELVAAKNKAEKARRGSKIKERAMDEVQRIAGERDRLWKASDKAVKDRYRAGLEDATEHENPAVSAAARWALMDGPRGTREMMRQTAAWIADYLRPSVEKVNPTEFPGVLTSAQEADAVKKAADDIASDMLTHPLLYVEAERMQKSIAGRLWSFRKAAFDIWAVQESKDLDEKIRKHDEFYSDGLGVDLRGKIGKGYDYQSILQHLDEMRKRAEQSAEDSKDDAKNGIKAAAETIRTMQPKQAERYMNAMPTPALARLLYRNTGNKTNIQRILNDRYRQYSIEHVGAQPTGEVVRTPRLAQNEWQDAQRREPFVIPPPPEKPPLRDPMLLTGDMLFVPMLDVHTGKMAEKTLEAGDTPAAVLLSIADAEREAEGLGLKPKERKALPDYLFDHMKVENGKFVIRMQNSVYRLSIEAMGLDPDTFAEEQVFLIDWPSIERTEARRKELGKLSESALDEAWEASGVTYGGPWSGKNRAGKVRAIMLAETGQPVTVPERSKELGERLIDSASATIEAARARMAARAKARGFRLYSNPIPDPRDVRDLVVIVVANAAKVVGKALQTQKGRALSATVYRIIKEYRPEFAAYRDQIRRAAMRALRAMGNNPDNVEPVLHSILYPPKTKGQTRKDAKAASQARAEKVAGLTNPPKEEATVTANDAMLGSLKDREKLSARLAARHVRELERSVKTATREGVHRGWFEASNQWKALTRQVREGARRLREVGKLERRGGIDEQKAEQAVADGIRAQVLAYAKTLPKDVRGALVTAITNANTPAKYVRAMRMLDREAWRSMARHRIKRLELASRPSKLAKQKGMSDFARTEIAKLRQEAAKQIAIVRAAGVGTNELRAAALELGKIHEMILMHRAAARAMWETVDTERRISAWQAAKQTTKAVRENASRLDTEGMLSDPKVSWLTKQWRGTYDLRNALGRIEGITGARHLFRLMFQRSTAAETKANAIMRDKYMEGDKAFREAGFEGMADFQRQAEGRGGEGVTKYLTVTMDGRPRKLTLAQAIGLYAHSTDPQTMELILTGEQAFSAAEGKNVTPTVVTPEEMAALAAQLTPGQKSLIPKLKAIMESLRADDFRVKYRLTGKEPVPVPDRWPRPRNMAMAPNAGWTNTPPAVGQGALAQWTASFIENDGRYIERTQNATIPILIQSPAVTFREEIEKAATMIAKGELIRDAMAVYLNDELRAAIVSRYGSTFYSQVYQQFMAASGMTRTTTHSMGGRAAAALNRLAAIKFLGLNLGTLWRNISGGIPMLPHLDKRHLHTAAAKVAAGASITELLDESGYFWNRYEMEPSRRLSTVIEDDEPARHRLMQQLHDAFANAAEGAKNIGRGSVRKGVRGVVVEGGKNLQNVAAMSLVPLAFVDSRLALIAYEASKAEAREAHPSWTEAQVRRWAAKKAEDVFRETQTPSSDFDRSISQVHSRDSWTALLGLFTSDLYKARNRLVRAFTENKDKAGRILAAEVMGRVVGTVGATAISASIAAAFAAAFGWDEDDEEAVAKMLSGERMAMSGVREVVALLSPIFGSSAADFVELAATGKMPYRKGLVSPPAIEFVNGVYENVLQNASRIMKGLDGDPDFEDDIGANMLDALNELTSAAGINPASNWIRQLARAWRYAN